MEAKSVGRCAIDFSSTLKIDKTPLLQALRSGKWSLANKILESRNLELEPFSIAESWQIKVLSNSDFDDEEFILLDSRIRNLIYRTANGLYNVQYVQRLNLLGMNIPEEYLKFCAPNMFSKNMDVARISRGIHDLLVKWRRDNRLITKDEGLQLPGIYSEWLPKTNLTRISGKEYLESIISSLCLQHIKVPEKKAVLASGDQINIYTYNLSHLTGIGSEDITILSKKVESCGRYISRIELIELVKLIDTSKFSDLWDHNFIVAEDGIYLIDTELKSFQNELIWLKLNRLSDYVSEADREFFHDLINEKIEQQKQSDDNDKIETKDISFEQAMRCMKDAKGYARSINKLVNKENGLEYLAKLSKFTRIPRVKFFFPKIEKWILNHAGEECLPEYLDDNYRIYREIVKYRKLVTTSNFDNIFTFSREAIFTEAREEEK
jgi:hypothetical protein